MRLAILRTFPLLALIPTCLLISSSSSLANAQTASRGPRIASEESQQTNARTTRHEGLFELGDVLVATDHNRTDYTHRLKLYKSDFVIRILTADRIMTDQKWAQKNDLRRCDGTLALRQPSVVSDIDCLPLDGYLNLTGAEKRSIDSEPQGQSVTYALRRVIKTKIEKQLFGLGMKKLRLNLHLYDLKPATVEKNIGDILIENKLAGGLKFDQTLQVGHYFELTMGDELISLNCVGQIYLAINTTEKYEPNERWPESLDSLRYLARQAPDGLMVSLKDVQCGLSGHSNPLFIPVTLDNEILTIIWRQQIPYLTVKHRISTSPFESIFSYRGSIQQYEESSGSLKTITNMVATSAFDMLNFELRQTVLNEGDRGSERMDLYSRLLTASVRAVWTNDLGHLKILRVFLDRDVSAHERNPDPDLEGPKPTFQWTYENQHDTVQFNFEINKNIFNGGAKVNKRPGNADKNTAAREELLGLLKQADMELNMTDFGSTLRNYRQREEL